MVSGIESGHNEAGPTGSNEGSGVSAAKNQSETWVARSDIWLKISELQEKTAELSAELRKKHDEELRPKYENAVKAKDTSGQYTQAQIDKIYKECDDAYVGANTLDGQVAALKALLSKSQVVERIQGATDSSPQSNNPPPTGSSPSSTSETKCQKGYVTINGVKTPVYSDIGLYNAALRLRVPAIWIGEAQKKYGYSY
ncbi:MAG: hypothetical protein LBS87_00965 [Puniceicoccales bacterium]|nr:hypothetical protein [Puniceicoccales bacterium]